MSKAPLEIETCLFDMGNVLVLLDDEKKNRCVGATLGLSAKRTKELLETDELQWAYESGRMDTKAFLAKLMSYATKACTPEAVLHAFCDFYRPNLPMQPVLAALKAAGKRLVVVSNTNPGHVEFVRQHFHPFDLFDELIFSHEIKVMKPLPGFYERAREAAHCPPERALFIDDSAQNIEGAKRAGFVTHLYDAKPEGHAAFLQHLRELRLAR